MHRRRSRGLRSDHVGPLISFHPSVARHLVRALNAGGADAQALREVVRKLNEVDRRIREKRYPGSESKMRLFDKPENLEIELRNRGFDDATRKLLNEIQREFGEFKLTMWPAYPQKSGWKFLWMIPGIAPDSPKVVYWMNKALVHDLAAAGLLRSVRECDFCQDWYFARKKDHRFCKRYCRERHHRSSEEGKAKRAEYMRNRRKREKNRKSEW
jgi:hypothetical protein